MTSGLTQNVCLSDRRSARTSDVRPCAGEQAAAAAAGARHGAPSTEIVTIDLDQLSDLRLPSASDSKRLQPRRSGSAPFLRSTSLLAKLPRLFLNPAGSVYLGNQSGTVLSRDLERTAPDLERLCPEVQSRSDAGSSSGNTTATAPPPALSSAASRRARGAQTTPASTVALAALSGGAQGGQDQGEASARQAGHRGEGESTHAPIRVAVESGRHGGQHTAQQARSSSERHGSVGTASSEVQQSERVYFFQVNLDGGVFTR
jgi:hypothetical protein